MMIATAAEKSRTVQPVLPGSIPELMPRLRALLAEGRTELAPETLRVPIGNYNDPAILAAERREILERVPLFVAPSQQIPGRGDYLTRDLVERPVLAVRGDDGVARVFINACRHRGALVAEGEGCRQRFTCPYHAWTYDSAGKLIGVPGQEGFSDVDRSTLSLVELPSAERHGLIFAQLDTSRPIDIDTHLGPMSDELASWTYGELDIDSVVEIEYQANWKSALEAFAETYHFQFVHANSGPGLETVGNVVTFDNFGPHHRIGVPLKHMVAPDKFPHQIGCSVLHWVYPNLITANSRMGTEFIDILPGKTPHEATFRHTLSIRGDLNLPPEYKKKFGEATRYAITQEDTVVVGSAAKGLRFAGHDVALIGRNEPGPRNIHLQLQRGRCQS